MRGRVLVLTMSVIAAAALSPASVLAQTDDLLTPLTPKESAPKKKAQRKKPRPEDDAGGLVVPLVTAQGEILVKVKGPADRAIVLIDGRELKAEGKVKVDAGERLVVVKRPGFSEFSKRVKVPANGLVEVSAVLQPVAGVLTVYADVPGAEVLIDGRPLGEAPLQDVTVAPGTREVIVRREGFEDHVAQIVVAAGRDYSVSGHLRPKSGSSAVALVPRESARPDLFTPGVEARPQSQPWYGRWYIWAGAGAVVAAAVTSAVVVNSNNRAMAPIRPEDVCGGACAGTINAR